MTLLTEWAQYWGVSDPALVDLRARVLGLDAQPGSVDLGVSEAAVQAQVRVAASKAGMRVWRNNVGAVHDPVTGMNIRFGLANDSPQINKVLKSADLIGIRPIKIGPQHVGHVVGQFVSFECKRGGWRYMGTEREVAQESWAALVASLGGVARFISDPSHGPW